MEARTVWSWRLLLLFLLFMPPLMLAAEFQTHTVKKGETLYSLGRLYGVSVEQIKELNGLNSNSIGLNQVLKIKVIEAKPAPVPAPPPPAVKPREAPQVTEQADPPTAPATNLSEDHYYTVAPKDNLYRIALNHGLTMNDMLRWNGFADATQVIHPGDRIIVKDPGSAPGTPVSPAQTPGLSPAIPQEAAAPDTIIIEKIYVVQKKDTLFRIAKDNGMTVEELKRLNNLSSNEIKVGQRIYLAGTPSTGPVTRLTEAEVQKSDRIRTDLIMPTQGSVTSEYGLRHGRPHKGIDIAAKTGTPIYAVMDGVVVYSGVQGGYGNVVVIEHPDFVMTVYAHNEKNLVKVDDRVKQGQLIAYMGATGRTTGPHLHFEYRLKGKAINPRKVLPF